MELQINPKFKDLIPPLDSDEYENLRESLINEGCRDALITWDGVIVDGHNRYEICRELDIPFNTLEVNFESEDDALFWIMQNQLSRRNLSDVERSRITLKLKDNIAARAKINMLSVQNNNAGAALANLPKLVEPVNTRKELARIAGVGERTLAKIEKVDNEAPAPIRAAMGKTLSIDKAARFNNFLQQVPEDKREAEAERLLAEFKQKEEQINREEKISKILCNIISAATIDYEYLTDECVEIYLKRSPSTIPKLIADIDFEISLLKKLKGLFLKAGGAQPQEEM